MDAEGEIKPNGYKEDVLKNSGREGPISLIHDHKAEEASKEVVIESLENSAMNGMLLSNGFSLNGKDSINGIINDFVSKKFFTASKIYSLILCFFTGNNILG